MINLSTTKEVRIYNGDKTVSSIREPGKPGELHVRVKLEYSLTLYTKATQHGLKT